MLIARWLWLLLDLSRPSFSDSKTPAGYLQVIRWVSVGHSPWYCGATRRAIPKDMG